MLLEDSRGGAVPEEGESFIFSDLGTVVRRLNLAFGALPGPHFGTDTPWTPVPPDAGAYQQVIGNNAFFATGIIAETLRKGGEGYGFYQVTLGASVEEQEHWRDSPWSEETTLQAFMAPATSVIVGLREKSFRFFFEGDDALRVMTPALYAWWAKALLASVGLDPAIFNLEEVIEAHYGEWSSPEGYACTLPGGIDVVATSPFDENGEEWGIWGIGLFSPELSVEEEWEPAPECSGGAEG